MTRRERPLMYEERQAIKKLSTTGMSVAAIAVALFISKRQVKFALTHDDTEAVRRDDI